MPCIRHAIAHALIQIGDNKNRKRNEEKNNKQPSCAHNFISFQSSSKQCNIHIYFAFCSCCSVVYVIAVIFVFSFY